MNSRTAVPGMLMASAGLMIVGWSVLALVFLWFGALLNVGVLAAGQQQGMGGALAIQGISAGMGTVIDLLWIVCGAMISVAGLQLRSMGNRSIVMVGAVLCLVQPVAVVCTGMWGGCGLCGCLPSLGIGVFALVAGIMAIVTMNDPDVVDAWLGTLDAPPPEF